MKRLHKTGLLQFDQTSFDKGLSDGFRGHVWGPGPGSSRSLEERTGCDSGFPPLHQRPASPVPIAMTTTPPRTLSIVRFTARAIGAALDQIEAAGMAGKWLAAAALGSLLAGAAIFVILSPDAPSKANLDGVTIQGQPTALSVSSKAAFTQCLLTLNSKFTAPAKLAVGETLVPWSRFVREQDVRFDPEVDGFGTLMIDCLKPVHGVGLFRFKR